MNAYEFIKELLFRLKHKEYKLKMYYYTECDDIDNFVEEPYAINIDKDYCTIKPGQCTLGVSVDDSGDLINNVSELKEFFKANNVQKTDQMFLNSDSGVHPIKKFVLEYDNYDSFVCYIKCY